MRRTTILVAVAALAVVACSKSKGGLGGGKPTGAAAAALDFLPEDTGFIAGASVKKLTSSKLWEKYGSMLLGQEETKKTLDDLKSGCGLDPLKDIESVLMAGPASMDDTKMVIVVSGKFDEKKITSCVEKMAEREGKKVSAKTEGKITTYTNPDDASKTIEVAWIKDNTIMLAPEGGPGYLKSVLEAKSHAKDNKKLYAMVEKVNTSETLWVAMEIPPDGQAAEAFSDIASGHTPTGFWTTVAYQSDLKVDVGLRFADEKAAKEVADKIDKELQQVKKEAEVAEYAKSFNVKRSGSDVQFTGGLSEKQINKLLEQFGGMLPMLLMGLGG